jgi:hypothetical protein
MAQKKAGRFDPPFPKMVKNVLTSATASCGVFKAIAFYFFFTQMIHHLSRHSQRFFSDNHLFHIAVSHCMPFQRTSQVNKSLPIGIW